MNESRWRRNVRYSGWMIRTVPPLDFGAEIWVDPHSRPDFGEWEELAHRLGEDQAVDTLGHFMTRTLLHELLLAGGGVEAEYLRLGDALQAAQEETDEHVSKNPSLIAEPWPEFGVHTSALPLLEAHYAFWGFLSWVRAVAERAERPYKGKGGGMVGLLPAMAPGPRRDRVEVALAGFKSKTRDCRAFANDILHAGAIPGGGTPSARVQRSGQVRIPLPDPPSSSQIASWEQFEYRQDRDAWTYAQELLAAVEVFIDGVISAFEEHLPERFRAAHP